MILEKKLFKEVPDGHWFIFRNDAGLIIIGRKLGEDMFVRLNESKVRLTSLEASVYYFAEPKSPIFPNSMMSKTT